MCHDGAGADLLIAMTAVVPGADIVDRLAELGGRIAIAGAVTVAFIIFGRLVSPLVRAVLDRKRRPSYTRVFSGLFRVAVALVGFLVSLTVAFPSVRVADVLAIFGIISVAAGFAFKDTFENLLAGVLLMLRDPFKSGDQVTIAGTTGTVEGVTVRETLLRGHDGRRYFVPNAKVMTDVIDVETDRVFVRQSFRMSVERDCDLHRVGDAIREALANAEGVATDPAPDVMVVDIVDGDPVLECRFWAGSTRAVATKARDAAITAVLNRLVADGVRSPTPEHRVTMLAGTRGDVRNDQAT
jgi:small conductance mechanosensitive channel